MTTTYRTDTCEYTWLEFINIVPHRVGLDPSAIYMYMDNPRLLR